MCPRSVANLKSGQIWQGTNVYPREIAEDTSPGFEAATPLLRPPPRFPQVLSVLQCSKGNMNKTERLWSQE